MRLRSENEPPTLEKAKRFVTLTSPVPFFTGDQTGLLDFMYGFLQQPTIRLFFFRLQNTFWRGGVNR